MNGDGMTVLIALLLIVLLLLLTGLALNYLVWWISLEVGKKKAYRLIDGLLDSIRKDDKKDDNLDDQELVNDALTLIHKKLSDADSVTLLSFVEDYLFNVIESHPDNLENYKMAKTVLESIVRKERIKLPYNGLGGAEQSTMHSIEDIISIIPEREKVRVKLGELADSIRNDKRNLQKAKRLNAWTIPMAVISFLLTLITFFGGTKISKKDFNELDKQVSSAISHTLDSLFNVQNDTTLTLVPVNDNN